jgi:hypothetical protein
MGDNHTVFMWMGPVIDKFYTDSPLEKKSIYRIYSFLVIILGAVDLFTTQKAARFTRA